MIEAELQAAVQAWIGIDPDPATRGELEALLAAGTDEAAADLRDRFDGRLRFGTSGLRAARGAGPRRMNRVVVRQTAAALAHWLGSYVTSEPTVIIGWDARHGSADHALDTARVIAAAGGWARLLPGPLPTPVLAFAVRLLHADAGVMCTASHNPAQDNGYKVYLGDGAQIVPPIDNGIARLVEGIARRLEPVELAAADDEGIERLDHGIVDDYCEHVAGRAAPAPGPLRIAFTPMHGVAGALTVRILREQGYTDVHVVAEQAEPDADFPTLPHPNPEEPGALDRVIDLAAQKQADIVLATDPDGDRLGVAVPSATGDWRVLTGNEIGALLAEHVLTRTTGADRLVVTTIVSSRLLPAIAAHHGVHHVETLTGFKWIVRPALAHPDLRFVFGFEEALGFSVDRFIRDKDGMATALVMAEIAAGLRLAGHTVEDQLDLLSRRHGHHATCTWSVRFDGFGAEGRMAAVLQRWRDDPPTELGGIAVREMRDLKLGHELPPTDALVIDRVDGARVVVRPSGTEPKLKLYVEAIAAVGEGPEAMATARADGAAEVGRFRSAVMASLGLS